MKVNGGKPPESPDVVRLQKAGKNGTLEQAGAAEAAGRSRVSDKVDVSGRAREIADIMGAVKSIPDVRTEKVAEIKGLVESGKYVADPVRIAGRMIDEVV
jgi:flagellar biosynthesis anti-sigma factor FlgM